MVEIQVIRAGEGSCNRYIFGLLFPRMDELDRKTMRFPRLAIGVAFYGLEGFGWESSYMPLVF